jgi:hypothetical protein
MTREKMFFLIALPFIAGAPAIGFGLQVLSSIYNLPELLSAYWGILFLYVLFLDGVFSHTASEKTFYQISSYTLKDRVLFFIWISTLSILLSVAKEDIELAYKLPVLFSMTFLCYFSYRSFSPQVKLELREKLRYPK